MGSPTTGVESSSFVLRVKNHERGRLYARRELYIGIRRQWQKGSRIFFASRMDADVLIGSGVFEKIIELDAMDEEEHRFCLQNNWYGKIVFDRVERFLPPLPIRETPLAECRPALLHGINVSEDHAAKIDTLVSSRIIS